MEWRGAGAIDGEVLISARIQQTEKAARLGHVLVSVRRLGGSFRFFGFSVGLSASIVS
jgi:hypothetical protein